MVLVTPKYEMSSCSTTEQLPGFKLLRPENPNQTLTEVECLTFDFMFTTTTSSHFTNPYRSIITKKREIMTPRFPLKRSVSLDTIDTVDSIDTLDIETKFVERVCTKMKKAALFVAGTNRQAKDDSAVAKEKRGGISLSSILRRSSDHGVKFESCEKSVGSAESKDVWKQIDDERDKSFHDDDDSESLDEETNYDEEEETDDDHDLVNSDAMHSSAHVMRRRHHHRSTFDDEFKKREEERRFARAAAAALVRKQKLQRHGSCSDLSRPRRLQRHNSAEYPRRGRSKHDVACSH